jgi:hypothetical protein
VSPAGLRHASAIPVARPHDHDAAAHPGAATPQGQQATFAFEGSLVAGDIRSTVAKRLIREWAVQHRAQLEANWVNMEAGRALDRIEPLE